MLAFIYIACLLLTNVHPSQLDQDNSKEDEGDFPNTVFPCSENVSQPTIDSPTQEAIIGWNVTLECVSQRGSPPINYMLYKEKRKILQTVIKDKAGEKALFNFVISSDDKLGEYKCKVENQCVNSTKYSTGFTFKVSKDNVMVFIVAPLLVIVLAVIILLLVLWCRARKSKPTSSHTGSGSTTHPALENCTTYEKIAYENENEDVAYTEVKFDAKNEDYRKMFAEVDATVNYAEVAIRK